jgi:hypothetical protein
MALGIAGMLGIFFLTYFTNILLFLLSFYPFLALLILSIALILRAFHKFDFSIKSLLILATLLIGGALATFSLEALVTLLTQIL